MNTDHVKSIRRGLRWPIAVSLLIVALGCASSPNGAPQMAPTVEDIAASMDLTGTRATSLAVKKAANEVASVLDEFDVEKFNAALEDVHKVMDQVSQRLDAVPVGDVQSAGGDLVDSIMLVRAQLERMKLTEAVKSVRDVAEGIDAAVKTLDIQRARAAIVGAEDSLAGIRTDVAKLSESLGRAIDNLGRQLDQAGEKIKSFPVEALREDLDTLRKNLDSIDQATKSLESTLQRAGATLFAATVTLWMISLCALAWLVKFLRRRSA